MLTLRELKMIVPTAKTNEDIHRKNTLIKTGAKVVVSETIDNDVKISVYDNGYVLYEEGKHKTIFRLHECKSYEYYSKNGTIERVEKEIFENQKWDLLLLMIGMERVETNRSRLMSKHKVLSFDTGENDYLSIQNIAESDMLEKLIIKETIGEIKNILSERQMYAITAYYCGGLSQERIAADLSISQQGVSILTKRALEKIRDYMQISSCDITRKRNKK